MDIEDVECDKCKKKVPFHRRTCHVCENDIGFPNVRLADKEETELVARYDEAYGAARAKGTADALKLFEDYLDISQVIIVKTMGKIIETNSDNQMLSTFYSEVNANSRVASNNSWDYNRHSVDSAINPIYTEHIHFGVMSVNSYGAKHYGSCHIKLKDEHIKERTSFFEENPFLFCQKQGQIAGEPIPPGYRSNWSNRCMLAITKLQSAISTGTTVADYGDILIKNDHHNSDFIEAHIFGSISKFIFEEITFLELSTPDKALLNVYKDKFEKSGIRINTGE
jgi:hypothetical protein